MVRTAKTDADYFPHYAASGKTLFTLEKRYGNDGYAFWFKLLEMMSSASGHYIVLDDDALIYMADRSAISEEKTVEIIELLVRLGKIDAELWMHERGIWVQGLVDNLEPLYVRRKAKAPQKPHTSHNNTAKEAYFAQESQQTSDNSDINPQSKVKESKEKQSKEKDIKTIVPSARDIDDNFALFWGAWPKERRIGKKAARDKFAARIKNGTAPGDIIQGAIEFSAWCKRNHREPQYIPHPSVWLNGNRWEDELVDDAVPMTDWQRAKSQQGKAVDDAFVRLIAEAEAREGKMQEVIDSG